MCVKANSTPAFTAAITFTDNSVINLKKELVFSVRKILGGVGRLIPSQCEQQPPGKTELALFLPPISLKNTM